MARNSANSNSPRIIRVPVNTGFTTIHNETFQTKGLSIQAMGLLIHLLSKPQDWDIRVSNLANFFEGTKGGSDKSIRNILRELINAGYLEYFHYHEENGHFGHVYYLYPLPKKVMMERYPDSIPPPPQNIINKEDKKKNSNGLKKCSPYSQKGNVVKRNTVNGHLLLNKKETRKEELRVSVAGPPQPVNTPDFSKEILTPQDQSPEPEKIEETPSQPPDIPDQITINTTHGKLTITQSQLYLQMSKRLPQAKIRHIEKAWKVLADYQNTVHDWVRFIEGTVLNLQKKETSKNINNSGSRTCKNQKREKESPMKLELPRCKETSTVKGTLEQHSQKSPKPMTTKETLANSSDMRLRRLAEFWPSQDPQESERPTSAQPCSSTHNPSTTQSELTQNEIYSPKFDQTSRQE